MDMRAERARGETIYLVRVLFCAAAVDNLKIRSTEHATTATAKQLQALQSPLNEQATSPSYVSAVSCTDSGLSTWAGARHARDFGRNFGDCTLNPKPKTLNPQAQKLGFSSGV